MSSKETDLKEKFRIALNSTAKVISGDFDLNNNNIEGIIVGKAIYDGDINLDELAKEIDA